MSGFKVKVSVLDVDGVEENEGPCERLLRAIDIDVDDSSIGSGSDDLQNVLEYLATNTTGSAFTCFRGGNSSNLNSSSGISCARGGNSSVI